jgi:cytochrome c553
MYVNKPLKKLFLLAGLLFLPVSAMAVNGAVHDVHRLPANDEFQSTIEARCTICHTRERVDAAISRQEDLDALMQRMIERGAILSEHDQKVLGTFWGSPLKGESNVPSGKK